MRSHEMFGRSIAHYSLSQGMPLHDDVLPCRACILRPEAPVVNMRYPIVQAQILTGKKRQGHGRASKTVVHAVAAERTAVEQSARWVGRQANVKHAHSLMQAQLHVHCAAPRVGRVGAAAPKHPVSALLPCLLRLQPPQQWRYCMPVPLDMRTGRLRLPALQHDLLACLQQQGSSRMDLHSMIERH